MAFFIFVLCAITVGLVCYGLVMWFTKPRDDERDDKE